MMGYYGEPDDFGEYGSEYEYADAPYQVGSDEVFADGDDLGGYDGYGGYGCACNCGRSAPGAAAAEPGVGYYGYYADPYGLAYPGFAAPGYGYGFGDPYGMAGWGYGEYATPYGYGYADPGLAQSYDLEGYDDYADQEFGDDIGAVDGWYGADDLDGYDAYVPDGPSRYNYSIPAAMSGYEADELDGYTPPTPVSPACGTFKPQPVQSVELPETLRPLW